MAMSNALREELFKLSAAERLELVEELWDSIADEDEALALTEEQREDLERRLAEGAWHGQLVGATVNETHAFPEPGTAVYTVLSGQFDRLP